MSENNKQYESESSKMWTNEILPLVEECLEEVKTDTGLTQTFEEMIYKFGSALVEKRFADIREYLEKIIAVINSENYFKNRHFDSIEEQKVKVFRDKINTLYGVLSVEISNSKKEKEEPAKVKDRLPNSDPDYDYTKIDPNFKKRLINRN